MPTKRSKQTPKRQAKPRRKPLPPAFPPAAKPTPITDDAARATTDALVDLSIKGFFAPIRDDIDHEITDLGGTIADTHDDLLACARGIWAHVEGARYPTHDEARQSAAGVEAMSAGVIAATLRLVSMSSRMVGLCQARDEHLRSEQSVEEHRAEVKEQGWTAMRSIVGLAQAQKARQS
jgi:hypothetical protein